MEKFGFPCTPGDQPAQMPGMFDEAYRFVFDNGYGASVIRGQISMGFWELAVMDTKDGVPTRINYEHPVAEGDLVRRESEDEIAALLTAIAATPARVS